MAITSNKQCDKVILQQDSNLQPLDSLDSRANSVYARQQAKRLNHGLFISRLETDSFVLFSSQFILF